MPRRIIFKNASSGQKGVTIQRYVQDTSLLWDRTRVVCSFDTEIHTEEVLILVTAFFNGNYLNDDEMYGENKRFIKVDYEKSKDAPDSKFDEFTKKNKGIPKSLQYASLRPNITQGAFFDNKSAIRVDNTQKSVCTDGVYIDIVRKYNIYVSQTLRNVTTEDDYLDTLHVFLMTDLGDTTGVIGMQKLESWSDLYILNSHASPYQLQPRFFGDNENLISTNKFWVLPPQFKSHGITYELYYDGVPDRVIENLGDISGLAFNIKNGVIDIKNIDKFCSYKLLEGTTPISGNFSQYNSPSATNVDTNGDLSYNSIITLIRWEMGKDYIMHKFSFENNIASGLVGDYHQLDETKTTTNGKGFFEEGVYKRGEDIANILLALNASVWYSSILADQSPNNKLVAFAYGDEGNKLEGGAIVTGADGIERYSFIDQIDGNDNKSISAGEGTRDFTGFTFKLISFLETKIIGCIFDDVMFDRCDFSGATFEDCTFKNLNSKDNIWGDFNYNYIFENSNSLEGSHKFIGGRFVGEEIGPEDDGVNFNHIGMRSYVTREMGVRKILTDADVSYNLTDPSRIDEVVFRSFISIDPYVNVEIDLSYVNLDDVSATDVSNLEQPFNIFVRESDEAEYVQEHEGDLWRTDDLSDNHFARLRLKLPPAGHKNLLDSDMSGVDPLDFFYRKYSFYHSESELDDHAVENPFFYNYQFQKDLTNPNSLKLVGFNNSNSSDHSHAGNWGIGTYPYNTIGSTDIMLSFEQTMQSTFGYTTRGPLTYYKLDVSYNTFSNKAFQHLGLDTKFKLRKPNLNYDYIDTTSKIVRGQGDMVGKLQVPPHPLTWEIHALAGDVSLNNIINIDLEGKLDNEFISDRAQTLPVRKTALYYDD